MTQPPGAGPVNKLGTDEWCQEYKKLDALCPACLKNTAQIMATISIG